MRKIILSMMLIIPAVLFAQQGNYTIKGKVGKLNSPATAYLTYRTGTTTVKDSTEIKKGQFEFKGTVADPIQASLIVNPDGPGIRGKQVRSLAFYLETGVIKISTPDSLANAKITGPKVNSDNEKLKLALKPTDEKMKAISSEMRALPAEKQKDESVRAAFTERRKAVNDEIKAIRLNFIKTNPGSLISLEMIKNIGGYAPEYADVAPLYNSLSEDIKNTTAGKEYAKTLEKIKATMVGAMAPEFTQNDKDGKPVKLADFRGKFVLIDFWASWCGPCRAENPNVVKAYNEYKDKGFTILGVSLDNETGRQKWLDAIQKDGLVWTQVTDLKFWNNEVAQQYGIRAIPQNVLVDPHGKIVAKNLRGKALDDKLAEILK